MRFPHERLQLASRRVLEYLQIELESDGYNVAQDAEVGGLMMRKTRLPAISHLESHRRRGLEPPRHGRINRRAQEYLGGTNDTEDQRHARVR